MSQLEPMMAEENKNADMMDVMEMKRSW